VRKETGRARNRFKIRDLFADERCSRAILDLLATTDVGQRIPDTAEDTQSEMSKGNLGSGKRRQKRGGRRRRGWGRSFLQE
jgi:hypothetical protein